MSARALVRAERSARARRVAPPNPASAAGASEPAGDPARSLSAKRIASARPGPARPGRHEHLGHEIGCWAAGRRRGRPSPGASASPRARRSPLGMPGMSPPSGCRRRWACRRPRTPHRPAPRREHAGPPAGPGPASSARHPSRKPDIRDTRGDICDTARGGGGQTSTARPSQEPESRPGPVDRDAAHRLAEVGPLGKPPGPGRRLSLPRQSRLNDDDGSQTTRPPSSSRPNDVSQSLIPSPRVRPLASLPALARALLARPPGRAVSVCLPDSLSVCRPRPNLPPDSPIP